MFARYVTYTDVEYTSTEKIPDTSNPNWNFTKQFSYKPASKEVGSLEEFSAKVYLIYLLYLQEDCCKYPLGEFSALPAVGACPDSRVVSGIAH